MIDYIGELRSLKARGKYTADRVIWTWKGWESAEAMWGVPPIPPAAQEEIFHYTLDLQLVRKASNMENYRTLTPDLENMGRFLDRLIIPEPILHALEVVRFGEFKDQNLEHVTGVYRNMYMLRYSSWAAYGLVKAYHLPSRHPLLISPPTFDSLRYRNVEQRYGLGIEFTSPGEPGVEITEELLGEILHKLQMGETSATYFYVPEFASLGSFSEDPYESNAVVFEASILDTRSFNYHHPRT